MSFLIYCQYLDEIIYLKSGTNDKNEKFYVLVDKCLKFSHWLNSTRARVDHAASEQS